MSEALDYRVEQVEAQPSSGVALLRTKQDHAEWYWRVQEGRTRVVGSRLNTLTGVTTMTWESKEPGRF